MKRSWLAVGLASLLGGCDLAELGQHPDAAAPDMGDTTTDMSSNNNNSDGGGSGGGDLARATDMDDTVIPPGSPIGSCDPAAWTATASQSNVVNPPSYAIDGLLPSRWSTGAPQAIGQYLQIDFGGFVMVSEVGITHTFLMDGATDFARGLDVLVSYDGVDFSRRLYSATYTADPGPLTLDFPSHAARQLRLQLTQGAATMPWWTIHELTIGCTVGAPPHSPGDGGAPLGAANPNIANWKASANFTNGTDVPANAFDGNPTTRWSTGKLPQYGDEWYKLDLGTGVSITQVWLVAAGGDYPSAWEIDLSSDDATYRPAARGLGSDTTKMVFATQTARYVLIKQIGSGYNHWWSINELTVYQ
jgi:hypothetical protein